MIISTVGILPVSDVSTATANVIITPLVYTHSTFTVLCSCKGERFGVTDPPQCCSYQAMYTDVAHKKCIKYQYCITAQLMNIFDL